MHLLSEDNRREFHSRPSLVRLTLAHGEGGLEPTLLIKVPSLSQKYLLTSRRFDLFIAPTWESHLVYGVRIYDDPAHPMLVWSAVAEQDELDTLSALTQPDEILEVFLFNEAVISTAWFQVKLSIDPEQLSNWAQSGIRACSRDTDLPRDEVRPIMVGMETNDPGPTAALMQLHFLGDWTPGNEIYYTNSVEPSLISFAETDEGGQQEQLAVWLTDQLKPTGGVVHSPQIDLENGRRELCDLLLPHEHGAVLVESKSTSIFARKRVPPRDKLTKDVEGHLRKAVRQLAGGLAAIREGHSVTRKNGELVQVERTKPAHAIVLVPDLTLLEHSDEFGGSFLLNFAREHGACLQILDPQELFRVAQAATVLHKHSKSSTLLEAFDGHLFSRLERALQQPTPCFQFLLRVI